MVGWPAVARRRRSKRNRACPSCGPWSEQFKRSSVQIKLGSSSTNQGRAGGDPRWRRTGSNSGEEARQTRDSEGVLVVPGVARRQLRAGVEQPAAGLCGGVVAVEWGGRNCRGRSYTIEGGFDMGVRREEIAKGERKS